MTSFIRRAIHHGIAGGIALGLGAAVAGSAMAVPPDFFDKLNSDARPMEDKVRDAVRRPYQVMTLLGVEEGWTVVDVAAGGGWYTEVISAAVGPEGTVLSQVGPRALQNGGERAAAAQARADRLGNVEVITEEMSGIPAGSADAALTALNLHDAYNFRGEDGALGMLQDIYDVLKPGGVAAIIDHEGEEGADNTSLHRLPAITAEHLLNEVGFEIVEDSLLLHTYADDHTLEIRAPELGRNSDRFLFIVRKPS